MVNYVINRVIEGNKAFVAMHVQGARGDYIFVKMTPDEADMFARRLRDEAQNARKTQVILGDEV